ncbi:hypothetical protein Tco_1047533 [Tanacetum coccineum]
MFSSCMIIPPMRRLKGMAAAVRNLEEGIGAWDELVDGLWCLTDVLDFSTIIALAVARIYLPTILILVASDNVECIPRWLKKMEQLGFMGGDVGISKRLKVHNGSFCGKAAHVEELSNSYSRLRYAVGICIGQDFKTWTREGNFVPSIEMQKSYKLSCGITPCLGLAMRADASY